MVIMVFEFLNKQVWEYGAKVIHLIIFIPLILTLLMIFIKKGETKDK